MGHKPDQRARKKRRDREKAATFADTLRAETAKAPENLRRDGRAYDLKTINEIIKQCRDQALVEARLNRRSAHVNVHPPSSFGCRVTEAEMLREIVEKLTKKDGLKVEHEKKMADRSNEYRIYFTLTW